LIKEEVITKEQLADASKEAERENETLEKVLISSGLVSEERILTLLGSYLGIPYLSLSNYEIDLQVVTKVPAKFVYGHKLFPLQKKDNVLTIAVRDPLDVGVLEDLRLLLGCRIETVLAKEEDIMKAIRKYYGIGAETVEKMIQSSEIDLERLEKRDNNDLEEIAAAPSIIKFVNQLILEAFEDRATDIHIEPFEESLRIRYRIDGFLHKIPLPSTIKQFQLAIISRIKIMADLNIAEKRLPQDGRINLKAGDKEIDLRVATIPTLFGESVDIRILPKGEILLDLKELGFSSQTLEGFLSLIKRPHGIILVTGPTGSGKTTTLYAALNRINSTERNIITIEDPVEYQLEGINQIQVKPKIGLTFAKGLRSILRQDPDVILVGEIRDLETAEIAIRSALTGHLVFSTLHTNNAAGAVTRLIDMGIEPYLVASAVEGIIAQRLVRVICPDCKVSSTTEVKALKEIGLSGDEILYRGNGCDRCKFTGYRGRTGIYELLMVTEEMKRLILERTLTSAIEENARRLGMRTLREAGGEKILKGITTLEEIIRVTEE